MWLRGLLLRLRMNKSVLITGSSKGLGSELALVFAQNNYDIILHGRNEQDLRAVWESVVKTGVDCIIASGDLREERTIQRLYRIAQSKPISVLINNAGVDFDAVSFEQIKDEQIDDVLITNLLSLIKLTRRIYTLFLDRGGTIININSLLGLRPREFKSIYCASKWGLKGFTDSLRLEAAKHRIKVIGIYPGRIKTHFPEGMEPQVVAQKIYDAYNMGIDEIRLSDE